MNIYTKTLLFLITIISMYSCCDKKTTAQTIDKNIIEQSIFLGIDVLEKEGFDLLLGKRVGLVTNATGVNKNLESTIDILYNSPKVNLVALFAPEHGVRGNHWAGSKVRNSIDEKTKIPIYSLYGKNKTPEQKIMNLVDVIVYDIQDVGARSYTYISTMGIIMETAAKYNKEVMILDRPNPLGGNRVEGATVKDGFFSFVSRYKIPYVYGLTCGELALMLNNEGLLKNKAKCKLQVVKMQGWKRSMTFLDTKLHWVPTSPHIPNWQTAFYYSMTGILGEIVPATIGIGYTLPFQVLANQNIDAQKLAEAMNNLQLEGVKFRPIYFKPYYMSKKGKQLQGVQIYITDFKKTPLTDVQFYFLQEAHKLDTSYNPFVGKEKKYRMFDVNCGSSFFRNKLMVTFNYDSLKHKWNEGCENFKQKSETYYLYD